MNNELNFNFPNYLKEMFKYVSILFNSYHPLKNVYVSQGGIGREHIQLTIKVDQIPGFMYFVTYHGIQYEKNSTKMFEYVHSQSNYFKILYYANKTLY